eukprot:Selendium_serpulae@DN5457_c0_g1_i1.p1
MSVVATHPSAADAEEAQQKLGLLKSKLKIRDSQNAEGGAALRTSLSRNRQRRHMTPSSVAETPNDENADAASSSDSPPVARPSPVAPASPPATSLPEMSEFPDDMGEPLGTAQPCPHCSRTFTNPSTFEKHVKSCAASQNKKRVVYDAAAQRLAGVDGASAAPKTSIKKKNKAKKDFMAQSNAFRAMIAAARATDPEEIEKAQAVLDALPPDTSKVACPHCDRKFNAESADRHISVCARVFAQKPGAAAKPKGKAKAEAKPKSAGTGTAATAKGKAKSKAKAKAK